MDRVLVLTLNSRQNDLFNDAQLITNELEDAKLATVLMRCVANESIPEPFDLVNDIITSLIGELRPLVKGCYTNLANISIKSVSRSPLSGIVSINLSGR